MNSAFKQSMLFIFCSALGIISANGCCSVALAAAPPQPVNSADVDSQRLIIKLKSGTTQCDADGIAKLSSASRVAIEFVRSMSGGACVIQLDADSPGSLLQGQEILRQQPVVEWLEEDRKMKALMQK